MTRTRNTTTSTKKNKKQKKEEEEEKAVIDSLSSSSSPLSLSPRPYKLIAILSPAKTLKTTIKTEGGDNNDDDNNDDDDDKRMMKMIPSTEWTTCPCIDTYQHRTIVQTMKDHCHSSSTSKSSKSNNLSQLLGISSNLAQTAYSYWTNFVSHYEDNNNGNTSIKTATTQTESEYVMKPSICSFDGVVYQGLDITTLLLPRTDGNDTTNDRNDLPNNVVLSYLQSHVRTVDPVYGWLRPLDVIHPYRLEMATKNVVFEDDEANNISKKKNKTNNTKRKAVKLADFWKGAIRHCLDTEEKDLQQQSQQSHRQQPQQLILLNLASDEYSAAVKDWPHYKIVKVVFRHGGRVLSVHAKRARGLLVRYMTLHQIKRLIDICNFDLEGYTFQTNQSTSMTTIRRMDDVDVDNDDNDDTIPKEPIVLVFDRPASFKPNNNTKNNNKKKAKAAASAGTNNTKEATIATTTKTASAAAAAAASKQQKKKNNSNNNSNSSINRKRRKVSNK